MASPKATFVITAVDKTKQAFASINQSLAGVGKRAAAVTAAIVGAGVVVSRSAQNIARFGDSVELLGLKSVETFQEMALASRRVGISFETTAMGIQRLARRAQEGTEESQTLINAFLQFGVTVEELRDLSPDELFFEMARGLKEAEDAGRDLSQAARVLDSEGLRLLLTMRELNREGFLEAAETMRDLGVIMDEEVVEKARNVRRELETITAFFESQWDQAWVNAGQTAIDALDWIGERLSLTRTQVLAAFLPTAANLNALRQEYQRSLEEDEPGVSDEEDPVTIVENQNEALETAIRQSYQRIRNMRMGEAKDNKKRSEEASKAEEELQIRTAGRMLTNAARNSKLFFEINKVQAIAEAALDGKQAVLGAYKVGAGIGGPALGAAFAATAGAATGVYIASIASQQFGQGGGGVATGGPGGDSATAGELAGGGREQQFNVTFQSSLGYFEESSLRRLFDALQQASEDGSEGLSGRFVVQGI